MPAGVPADLFTSTNQPKGRPKGRTGSRAKLAQRFFEDTYAAWEEQGPSVLARAAFHDPVAFANMVARLMPQKIEVSTPTDGMSDERLADMLEFAERMAGLKAEQAKVLQGSAVLLPQSHKLIDENGLVLNGSEEGGGGPLCEEGGGGENTSYTQRAGAAEYPEPPSNPLNMPQAEPLVASEPQRLCGSCGAALAPHEIELCDRCGAPAALPYPVGKPFPKPDHLVARENRAALADEDIDPASLF